MPSKRRPTMKTPEVLRALRSRHAIHEGEWINIEEAFNIDFLTLACWSKRACKPVTDYPWIAYEVKVSRSDFTREIARPHKRERAVAISNQFYFAAPAGLIASHEIPADCGLVEVYPGGSRVVVRAPVTEAEPITQYEIANMLRHGINPSWIRSHQFRKASMKYREAQAEHAIKEAAEIRSEVTQILGQEMGFAIEKWSKWKARKGARSWRGEVVEVIEKTETTVKLRYKDKTGFHSSYEPRVSIGEFLLEFELIASPGERLEAA